MGTRSKGADDGVRLLFKRRLFDEERTRGNVAKEPQVTQLRLRFFATRPKATTKRMSEAIESLLKADLLLAANKKAGSIEPTKNGGGGLGSEWTLVSRKSASSTTGNRVLRAGLTIEPMRWGQGGEPVPKAPDTTLTPGSSGESVLVAEETQIRCYPFSFGDEPSASRKARPPIVITNRYCTSSV